MLKALVKILFAALLMVALLNYRSKAQEIARVDLTRNKAVDANDSTDAMPHDCSVTTSRNAQKPIRIDKAKLQVELSVRPGTTFTWGSTIQAEITMRNTGSTTLLLPWSIDPIGSKMVAGSPVNAYEKGFFEVRLKQDDLTIPLESESESGSLYSTNWLPENTLRLGPGQWIVANFKFRMEQQQKLSVVLRQGLGKATITANWRQIRFTSNWITCTHETGYYPYIYAEDARPLDVNVVEAKSAD